MSNLTRYRRNGLLARDPFSFARELFGNEPWALALQPTEAKAKFAPRFDVIENEDAYLVSADLPGIKEEDLDVSLSGNQLTIGGKRESVNKKEGETYHIYERSFGSFSRSFQLPKEADGDKVEAKLDDGVLTVTIGKRVEAKSRRISVKK